MITNPPAAFALLVTGYVLLVLYLLAALGVVAIAGPNLLLLALVAFVLHLVHR